MDQHDHHIQENSGSKAASEYENREHNNFAANAVPETQSLRIAAA
jgi:hypothetical protein